ncbi:MAG: hypothetical protein QOE41_2438 [Mycobacterium sp.]|nr:hypothetical protein [Mycobacterium sp.]
MNRLGVLLIIAGAMTSLSTGTANASPDVSGKSFSEASSALANAGYTVVVGSTVGDKLAQSDCLVTSQQDLVPSSFGRKQYRSVRTNTVVLSLNCYPRPASAPEPGSSASNPTNPTNPDAGKQQYQNATPHH